MSKPFYFKQFVIHQDRCAMKVGTDGVLLGAWAELRDTQYILDIGTGTGVIALMLAQRMPNALIDAIEIETNAAQQAAENVSLSAWATQINVYHLAVQEFETSRRYDLIVSNPPFFNNSLKSGIFHRDTARHTELLSYEDIIQKVLQLLASDGRFSLILPPKEGAFFIELAHQKGLYCNKICQVYHAAGKPIKRLLMEFSFRRRELLSEQLMIVDDNEVYTLDYRALTQDFYTIF